jgi:hypothetical protein
MLQDRYLYTDRAGIARVYLKSQSTYDIPTYLAFSLHVPLEPAPPEAKKAIDLVPASPGLTTPYTAVYPISASPTK